MRRMLALLLVCAGIVGVATPTVVPTRWTFGVVYWVGGVHSSYSVIFRVLTTSVGSVATIWNLPTPWPSGDGQPIEITAPDRETARRLLESEAGFPTKGIVIPTDEPNVYWGIPPLVLGDQEIQPLTVVVFPDLDSFQQAVGNYGSLAMYVHGGGRTACDRGLFEPWLCDLLGPDSNPRVLLPLVGGLEQLTLAAVHEFAHWLTGCWAELNGVATVPALLVEGLASYTETAYIGSRGDYLLPYAALWARQGGLGDVPHRFSYAVGASLIIFLEATGQMAWGRFLELLPTLIHDWDAQIAVWEPGWRAWLLEQEVPSWAPVYYEATQVNLWTCARMIEPLFPKVWDLYRQVLKAERGFAAFWDLLASPRPEPFVKIWEQLRLRERTFLWSARHDETLLPTAEALVADLMRLRKEGNWEKYVSAYIEGVRTIVAGLPALVGVTP